MNRGFYLVITQDRTEDLIKFLRFLLKYNKYSMMIVVADNEEDAYRKKTMVGFLSPFDATVYLDTDILVNGNLDYLFELAEKGFLGIYKETTYPFCNAGVLTIPKELKEKLSGLWLPLYNRKMNKRRGCWDQDILNSLLPEFPVSYLPREYNCILKEISPEQEQEMFKSIKIFHFLHCMGGKEKNYKSWRIYQGIETI